MPFTEEDKIIIKQYWQNRGWGSRKIFSRTGHGKLWTKLDTKFRYKVILLKGSCNFRM